MQQTINKPQSQINDEFLPRLNNVRQDRMIQLLVYQSMHSIQIKFWESIINRFSLNFGGLDGRRRAQINKLSLVGRITE